MFRRSSCASSTRHLFSVGLSALCLSRFVTACAEPLVVTVIGTLPADEIWLEYCDPLDPKPCPRSARCQITARGTQCIPQSQESEDTCTTQACPSAHACVRMFNTPEPSCRKLCRLSSGIGCSATEGCLWGLLPSPFGICEPLPAACTLPEDSTCRVDQACRPFWTGPDEWVLRCLPLGPAQQGNTCGDGYASCAKDLVCIRPDKRSTQSTCQKTCQANKDCPMPMQCTGKARVPFLRFCQA